MLKSFLSLAWATLTAVGLSLGAAPAQGLTVMTENYPPLNYLEGGEAKGASVEVVQLILKRLGEPTRVQVLPWARAYMLTSTTDDHVLFSMTRIESRETLFKWAGPLAVKKHAFYVLKESGIRLDSLNDAKRLTIGVQLDGVDQSFLIRNGFTNLDSISRWRLNATKLLNRRIHAWLVSTASAEEVLRELKLTDRIEKSVEAFQLPLYIAFSRNVPDEVVAHWQEILNALYRDGTAHEIFTRHGQMALFPDAES